MTRRSELDRRLRAAERAQQEVLPAWRRQLEAALGGDERRPAAEVAALLGVPTRRQVLRLGGLAIAGGAVLAACSSSDGDGDDGAARPTGRSSSTTAPDATDRPGPELDLVLANTAISLEALAVGAYGTALASGLVERPPVRDALTMFQAHHAAHRDALVAVVEAAGEEPFTTPNPVVRAAFVDPRLASAAAEADLVRLAYDIEQAAAQTYVHATGSLSTVELRATSASIAAVEARHAAILDALGGLAGERPARYPTTNPLPADALVTD